MPSPMPRKHAYDKPRRRQRSDIDELTYCPSTIQSKDSKRRGESCNALCPVVLIRGKRYKLKTCAMHAPLPIRRELGLLPGGKPGVQGRKRTPTAADILRERFEANADKYLKPFEEALTAIKPIVVGNGIHARVVEYDDLGPRIQAMNSMLDRIYGKPKQVQEFSGPGGEAIEVNVPSDETRQLDVARVLADVGALGNATPVMGIPENASAKSPNQN